MSTVYNHKIMYAKLLLGTLLLIHVSGCPPGWVQHGGLCFFFSRGAAHSWAEANSYCQAFGYKLAEPESQDVIDFIKAQLAKIPGKARYFLGGSDIFVERQWIWSTSQTKIAAHNWEPSEPDNVFGEDCLTVNHDGSWDDIPCVITIPYICEAENADVVIG